MKKILAALIAAIFLVTSLPLFATAADASQGPSTGLNALMTGPRSSEGAVTSNQWPTGNFPLMPNFSGQTPNATGSTGLKYGGTVRGNDGEYINVQITQVGKVYGERNFSASNLRNAVGWSHLILHFDPVLFENLDLDKSSITGPAGTFYLRDRAKGDQDIYKTDDYSASIPMTSIFKSNFTPQEDQRATMKLYLKDGHNLVSGTNYLIEHRTMAQTNDLYSQIYIRDYIMGIEDTDVRAFDSPAYMQYTGNLNVPYNTVSNPPKYSSYRQDVMSNAYSDVYIDWNTNELHVNYVYETTEDIRSGDRTQFVQLFPEKLKETLAPRNGVYAKFNHVYKRGDLAWGNDRGIAFTDLNSFAGTKDGQAGYRLRIPNNVSGYNHPWTWVTETTQAYRSNLSASNGRYMAYSKTHGPIANHMIYYIDPEKFMKAFDNLDDLQFTSFFVTKNDNEFEGGVLKNSESMNSLGVTKNMTNSPQIDDIYTDSEKITGDTGYNNANSNVFVVAKNFKDPAKSKTQLVNSDGKIEFYPANFDGVFDNMQKDDKLSFETIYRYANYYKSRPTIEKVKARIIFDKYDGVKDKAITVPSSDKFRGETGYVESGLGEANMPENPKRDGYIFKGWSTKKTTASEFAKAEKLTKVEQWNEGKAYKFDGTVPVNKSYRVYPVWEEENQGFTIVLHSNDGTNRVEKINVAYDEKLPTKATMDGIASMEEQYGELAKGHYSSLAKLPNGYATKDGDQAVFGKREGYNLVGWSAVQDNGNVQIEDLYSNMGMLAKDGEGKDGKYYLSTVRTKAQGIGQAAAGKLFEEITPDKNNEIHLYAAWKPYFDVTLSKSWYDSTKPEFKDKTVKEILQFLAHGNQQETPPSDASLAEPIQIGLLYRTAVTEANDPTITGQANYYLVDGSLKDLPKNGGPLKWNLPSYDAYGKRLSYIAVEFEQGQSGKDKYNGFGQKWTNIWASVADNLHKKPGEVWDNESISKVQTLVVPKGNGEVDAFSGATVRKLYEDGTAITETQANQSTVGTKPAYQTKFYNVKVNLANPVFKRLYNEDKEVTLKAPEDPRVQVVEFDLPEVAEKIIFKRDDTDKTKWNRVTVNKATGKWDASNETNYTLTEKDDGGEKNLVLKLDLEGKNRYKYLKTGQEVGATYYSVTINDKSGTAVEVVQDKKDAPSLNGLEQDVLETKNGEEYVVIKALAPTKELEQFQAGAVLTLFDASAEKGKEKEKTYKNLDGSDVTGTREGSYYVFRVPKSKNPDLVDGSNVAAYAEQEGYKPSRSTIPCKVDLKGPGITADKLTVYAGEEVNVPSAITTDEEALLTSFEGLPETMSLTKEQATKLATKWKATGKAGDTKGASRVTLVMTDKFGNKTEQDWTVEVVDRPSSDNVNSAVQVPNKISKDYSEYSHKIKIAGGKVGTTLKVYLTEPTNATVTAPVIVPCTEANQEIFISQGVGTNIRDKVWITQTEKDKKESKALAVPMDVKAPNSPTVESLAAGNKTLTLSNITGDTTKIFIRVGGQEKTLTRDKDHTDLWKDDKFNPLIMKDGKLTVEFNRIFNPEDKAQVIVLDDMLNPRSTTKVVEDYAAPDAPTIVAENKDADTTTVSGTSKNPGATVTIYEITKKTDPTTGEETEIRTPIGTAIVDKNGNYTTYIRPAKEVGTEVGAVVTENGKESPLAKTTVTENAGIIPFDPNDPNPTPNPDDQRYVTVTLDANGGQFAQGTKSSFYVLKTYEVKPADFDQARLGLEAPANKAFDKWTEDQDNKTAFTGKTFDKDATIYAGYKANDNVIPFDPNDPNKPDNPDPNKYVTVSLNANGGSFAAGTKSSFYVKKTYTMTTNDFAVAEKGLTPPQDKAFNAWALNQDGTEAFPAAGKKFDQDASVYAQYREGRDVIPGTGNDKPEGYVTVTFKADAGQATLEGETIYYVNPKGNVKLGGILAPTIKPVTGYAVSYPAWTYSDNQNAASIVKADTTATASLYDKDKVIPVQEGVDVTKPAGYLDVVFKAGDNGKLEGTSKFYVKPNTASKDVPKPTPIPNAGYKVKADAWNPLIPTAFDKDFTTTAQYEALPDISETPQAGYVMVQFDGGDHGKVTADNGKKTIIFVNPEKEIALDKKVPTVKADTNWSFDKWSVDGAAVDLAKPVKYTKDTVIKATYTSDISGESKDGFVLVQFKAGDKGVIETGNAKVYVKQNKEVDLTEKAPKIKANEGYVHTGWDKPLKGIFASATDITATYNDPKDISTTPVEGFKHITFADGDHVKIAEGAVKDYWVNPAKVVSLPAPDVTVDAGYMHIGWSANLTQKFTADTTITPTSMESTDVTPNKNDNYTEIKFVAGNHGKFVSIQGPTYSLWANPDKVVTIQPPQIDANQGYKLTGWMNSKTHDVVKVGDAIKGQFPKAEGTVQYIAQYGTLNDISDKPEKGYVAITFNAGANAHFEGQDPDKRIITYYVNPAANKTLRDLLTGTFVEPNLVYDEGYEKGDSKWTPDLVLDLTVDAAQEYTANVKSKGQLPGDTTPVPKNWKTVEFRIFDYDKDAAKITGGMRKYLVDPKEEVTLKAPDVKITKEGYSLDGWNHSLTGKFEQDTVIYALIGGDISTKPKEGFVKVTFAPGDNGKFEDGATTEVYVRKNTEVDLGARAPKVIPNATYSHSGWTFGGKTYGTDSIKTSFTEAENTITASYNQDIIEDPTTPQPPAGYARVIFKAGKHGEFEDGAKTNFDVRIAAKLTVGNLNKPKVKADEGFFFTKWDKGNDTLITESMDVTAQYSGDIIPGIDPNKPPQEGFVRITFAPGTDGQFKAGEPTFYDVRKDANKTLKDLGKPTVIANNGYTHIGWDKKDDTKLDQNMIVLALYKQTVITNPDTTKPVPDGYVRVTFDPTDKGTITSGTATQDVLIAGHKTLGDLTKPTVQGKGGNVFSGWDTKDDTKLDENITNRALTVTALYNDDMKPADPTQPIPKGYARVVFKAGENGAFEAGEITAYDVLMKKDVKRTLGEVKKPKVKANDGFTFKAWDKADTTELVVNEKTEVTATYNQNVIISDDPNTPVPDGYVRATFKTDGAKGAIEATINGVKKTTLETVVMDVLPKTKTVGELKANLTLTAKDDNVFEGWSKPDDYLVANNVTIEALYQGGQTNTPTATALNVGKDNFTTIKGKAEPGATVIARVNGEKVGEATANNDGDYIIKATKDGKKLPDRTEAKVTATKAPMTESAWQPVIVLPDANSDGIPDGDLQAPAKPKLDPPRTKDTQVTMKVPTEPDAKKIIVKVTEADGNPVTTVEAIKDGDTWKVDGKPLTVDDTDRISIPLPNTELKEGQKVIANVFDESDNKSEPAIKIVSNKDPLAKPEINTPKQRDKTVSGKAPGAEKVDVIVTNKDGTVADKKTDQSVNADGSFTVPVNDLKDGQKVTVKASAKDKDPSEASKKVGLELDKIKETKKEADGVVDQAIKDNNWKPDDPGANPFDKNLKDKMDKAADVIKDAEDNNDANDPTQDAVDQAEKELRDALNKKDADTKVSAVEDKVKNGEKPAAEDIQAAQDAIDKIEGSTDPTADDFDKDKKDLQDRLDKAKALDDLKDAKDDLDKVIDKAVEEKKPAEEIDKAKEDSKTGGDIINNGGDGKTAEEIVKVVEKIKETTKILGQPAIQIRIDSANYNSRNLALTTNPGRCKLSITIYYAAGGEETIETTTGPGGVATILLKTPLQLDDDIVVKASQDASTKDYLDNSISATVY